MAFDSISTSEFKLTFIDATLYIEGNIDVIDPGKFITPYLLKIHEYVTGRCLKEIFVDVRKLYFLNSSGVKALVEWLIKINDAKSDDQYQLNFIININLLWQEKSLNTLKILNPALIKITRSAL
jgi:hypothetical protein